MKNKILYFSAFLVFACGTDSDLLNESMENNNVTQQTLLSKNLPVENEIDEMFYEYVNSSQFVDFNLASKEFYDKLNLDDSNIADFVGSADILSWVYQNLESTDFANTNQVEIEWENIVNLKFEELSHFPNITDFVVTSSFEVSLFYFEKWVFGPYQTTTNEECLNEYEQCNNDAHAHHMANLNYYMQSTTGKDTAEILAVVNKKFMADLHYCNYNLDKCLGL